MSGRSWWQLLTPEQKARHTAHSHEEAQRHQTESLSNATSRGKAWTPQEDQILRLKGCTDHELALILNRSFHATRQRRWHVEQADKRGETIRYTAVDREYENTTLVRKKQRTPCACATLDTDHESWCPSV